MSRRDIPDPGPWLSLDEAAQRLSLTEAALLRMALQERLRLSLWLSRPCEAERYTMAQSREARGNHVRYGEGRVLKPAGSCTKIEGLCDLLMVGNGKEEITRRYQHAMGQEDTMDDIMLSVSEPCGLFVTLDQEIFALQERPALFSSSVLPEGVVLVVRTDELKRLRAALAGNPLDKPVGERERRTLLVIIAALARKADIDIRMPAKAGEVIARLTEELGTPVAARTIEEHLRRLREVLSDKG